MQSRPVILILAWLLTASLFAFGGYLLARRKAYAVDYRPVATVNGEAISKRDFDRVLQKLAGQQAMSGLIYEKLIFQEAKRLGITIDDAELKDTKGFDPLLLRETRASALLRKILLQDVPLEKKKKVYQTFQEELTLYEVSGILLEKEEDIVRLRKDLKRGSKFSELARTYSQDEKSKQSEGKLGSFTAPELRRVFWSEAARKISGMKEGDISEAVETPFGLYVFRLDKIKSNYDDLLPSVENLIAESKRARLMDGLLYNAKVTSDLGIPDVDTPFASPSATPLHGLSDKPSAKPTFHVDETPRIKPSELKGVFEKPTASPTAGMHGVFETPVATPSSDLKGVFEAPTRTPTATPQ